MVGKEELVRIHAICDCAAEHWEPVEDERRLISFLEEQLFQDVENDDNDDESREANSDLGGQRESGRELAHGASNVGEETHGDSVRISRSKLKPLSAVGGRLSV